MTARVTFREPQTDIEVPVGATLLEAATLAGAPLGSHCGGVGACAFCHVRIEKGAEHLSDLAESEEDGLDQVFDVRETSRLACQARVISSGDIMVRISDASLSAWMAEHREELAT